MQNQQAQDTLFIQVHRNLQPGREVKNYKELCRLLDQPIVTGNQKKAQLKEFQRYFDYEKIGQIFLITDIYNKPLDRDDKRRAGNNSIYVKFIEVILSHYLAQQDDFTCTLPKNQLWQLLGMVNSKYKKISTHDLESLNPCINSFMVNHFYLRCNQKLDKILSTALRNLDRRRLLFSQEQVTIITDDHQKLEASPDDIKKIYAIERSVIAKMGYSNIIQVFYAFKANEYYTEVNRLLHEEYGWSYAYKEYKFIYTPDDIKESIPESEVQLQKLLFNNKIIDCINQNASYLKNRNDEDWQSAYTRAYNSLPVKSPNLNLPDSKIIDEDGKPVFHYPEYYLEAQNLLADELLRIKPISE